MSQATIRCPRCDQDAPPGVTGANLCSACEEALEGERRHRRRVAVREKPRRQPRAVAGTVASTTSPATGEPPTSVREEAPVAHVPSSQEDPAHLAALLREVEELRLEAVALREENALLARGANLLLGSVADDLPPSRAMAIVQWEREWRLHRARKGATPGREVRS